MSIEENKEIVRRWIELSWTTDLDSFEDLLAPGCVFHGVGGPREIGDGIESLRRGILDIQVTIREQIAERDKVVSQWSVKGIHRGELWGYVPTGGQVTYEGITINRLEDGKIVEDWFEGDLFGLIEQLRNNKLDVTK